MRCQKQMTCGDMPVVMKMTMFFLDLAQIVCLGSGALKVVFITLLTSIQTAQLCPALTAQSHLNTLTHD